ncbi:MAG: hypothetical protein GF331_21805 [Chitinivibrionales bacterium]|nr:hypothetical protein [Chitinivibrionales bacterium]
MRSMLLAGTVLLLSWAIISAQNDVVTYAGGDGDEQFYCAFALSDGTVLIGGVSDDLQWIPAGVPKVELSGTAASGTAVPVANLDDVHQGNYSFLLHLAADGATILRVLHFPEGVGGAIRDIKTDNPPDAATGALYLSGLWTDAGNNTPDQCWFGKLDNNVIDGDPTQLSWIWTECQNGAKNKFMQNWDVGADGKIVFSSYKAPSAGAWHAVYRLTADGSARDVVPNWWDHGAWCVSLKPYNHDLRSLTWEDYNLVSSHSGKSKKKGKYPHDFYYAGPKGIDDTKGGYTGYRSDGKASTVIAIAVDKRDNTMYIGFNTPVDNNTHDFEPTVMAMRPDGEMLWYSHMYDEWTDANDNDVVDDGETHQCPPDQYVDGIAIDYTHPASAPQIVVLARSHGNAHQNFWKGTNSFHDQFTGTNGNEHMCWLGRFRGSDGYFVNSCWLAEYDPYGDGGFGAPYSDPNLDGWPSHNGGWADLKTTKGHDLVVDMAGQIYVLANSRGPVTTANAYQKATKPGDGLYGCWSDFARVHTPDFATLTYSTILSGPCDSTTGNGGGNISLQDVIPVQDGMILVGYHKTDAGAPKGEPMPASNVPSWGTPTPAGETAVFARLVFDQATFGTIGSAGVHRHKHGLISIDCRPEGLLVTNRTQGSYTVRLIDCAGRVLMTKRSAARSITLNTARLPSGAYTVETRSSAGLAVTASVMIVR